MSNAAELKRLFQGLAVISTAHGAIAGVPIPGRPEDFVARGGDGEPLILMRMKGQPSIKPPLRLRYVSVDYSATCRIQEESRSEPVSGTYAVVTCSAEDPALHDLFLHASSWVLGTLPDNPTAAEVQRQVDILIELFRKLSLPISKAISGFWGELLVISKAAKPEAWLESWHRNGYEKFDFSWSGVRLDVKSTELPQRIHEFSLEQLSPPPPTRGVIVSVMLRRAAGGLGVCDLVEKIINRLSPNSSYIEKLASNLAETLGVDFGRGLDIRFDLDYAEASLRVLNSVDVPAPKVDDSRILAVKFKVDVEQIARESVVGFVDLNPG